MATLMFIINKKLSPYKMKLLTENDFEFFILFSLFPLNIFWVMAKNDDKLPRGRTKKLPEKLLFI
jgi:hypothetical protein